MRELAKREAKRGAKREAKSAIFRLAVAMLVCCTALGGCATMSADECRNANWYEVGLKDGAHGKAVERLAQHREACADVKIKPDERPYLQGRQVGLRSYCTHDNAVREGLAGNYYEGVCEGPASAVFLRNYQAARAVHDARSRISSLDSSASSKEAELRNDKT
ncbi:hypothetical protein BH11PSE11_BH11PSE11_32300 [soil metagenome]